MKYVYLLITIIGVIYLLGNYIEELFEKIRVGLKFGAGEGIRILH